MGLILGTYPIIAQHTNDSQKHSKHIHPRYRIPEDEQRNRNDEYPLRGTGHSVRQRSDQGKNAECDNILQPIQNAIRE